MAPIKSSFFVGTPCTTLSFFFFFLCDNRKNKENYRRALLPLVSIVYWLNYNYYKLYSEKPGGKTIPRTPSVTILTYKYKTFDLFKKKLPFRLQILNLIYLSPKTFIIFFLTSSFLSTIIFIAIILSFILNTSTTILLDSESIDECIGITIICALFFNLFYLYLYTEELFYQKSYFNQKVSNTFSIAFWTYR